MRYFFIVLVIGVAIIALLLTVFFTAGKKGKKLRNADRDLVLSCGDQTLISLYEQADSDNERDGILEFVKEKLMRQDTGETLPEQDILPSGMLETDDGGDEEEETPPAPERNIIAGLALDDNEAVPKDDTTRQIGFTIDWQAVERETQQRREAEQRALEQNLHVQEVLAKVKDIETRILAEPVETYYHENS